MGVKILSLFDGMACGMIAMQLAGVEVESYDAYEIDKYAIKTAQHNFPMIKEHGDVFDADFTQYDGVDFLVGGSPCTYWSIAQTKNRETVASGMGWELFSQYVRALHEAKPKYFIYENNKSMSKQIRASIDEAFGFEAVLINSALVSAQNRQRLYWVGKRNEDGTYSKVNVEQPADRGILLKDVLDSAVARDLTCNDKSYTLTASYDGACAWNTIERHQRNMVAEPLVATKNGKSFAITANYVHIQDYPNDYAAHTIEKSVKPLVAEPVCVAERGRMYCGQPQHYEARTDGKTNTLTSVEKDNRVAEPISYCTDKNIEHLMRNFGSKGKIVDEESKTPTLMAAAGMGGGNHIYYADSIVEPINDICQVGAMPRPDVGYVIEFDDDGRPIKAIGKDGKEITIYEVKDGKITIKGKQYPIKLKDGYYIIRKLTVSECKRLQTVPEWYEFPVSNSQAYKMLGNGWTCEVIAHLIRSCNGRTVEVF